LGLNKKLSKFTNQDLKENEMKIGVIGIGYVGLPLSMKLGQHFDTIGYDVDKNRILDLKKGIDKTLESSLQDFKNASKLTFSDSIESLVDVDFFIVTVPTPIDEANIPDLSALCIATRAIGQILKEGSIVVYESTVYPSVTEDVCVPILEKESGGKLNEYFTIGYSPERINPGDKKNSIETVVKVISASNDSTLEIMDHVYSSIVEAGICRASSIQVAEAAKVIENVQRDVNIALMNEFSLILNQMKIDTTEVLKTASSKWNFMNFTPGLVGGHCIGVDPYYLAHQAKRLGLYPNLILAGRRVNDSMPDHLVNEFVKAIRKHPASNINKVVIFGVAFKENVPDVRNSLVIKFAQKLIELKFEIDIIDPLVEPGILADEYNLRLRTELKLNYYDAIIYAVPHDIFNFSDVSDIKKYGKENVILFDLKSQFLKEDSNFRM
jgi:UDP-N-acetyl-D-glucosamine/UDP-N-acetyl-D-galactosamine dehydrogenase